MSRARAMVLEAPRHFEVREFALPPIGDDDGLLRVEACGLCGTDHELYTGHLPAPSPIIPGHETVGVIEQLGDAAAARWGVSVGDRVAVECFQSCGRCEPCRAGIYRRCASHGTRTLYGLTPVDRPPSLWGGYADYHYLSPHSMLLPVPDSLGPIDATLFNPIGAGIRWGADLPDTGPGDAMTFKELTIIGALGVDAPVYRRALDLLATGRYPFTDLPRRVEPMEYAADLLATMAGETDAVPPIHAVLTPNG